LNLAFFLYYFYFGKQNYYFRRRKLSETCHKETSQIGLEDAAATSRVVE